MTVEKGCVGLERESIPDNDNLANIHLNSDRQITLLKIHFSGTKLRHCKAVCRLADVSSLAQLDSLLQ